MFVQGEGCFPRACQCHGSGALPRRRESMLFTRYCRPLAWCQLDRGRVRWVRSPPWMETSRSVASCVAVPRSLSSSFLCRVLCRYQDSRLQCWYQCDARDTHHQVLVTRWTSHQDGLVLWECQQCWTPIDKKCQRNTMKIYNGKRVILLNT